MGKKIQYIGRYNMDEEVLGKGNFARVELATHEVTEIKVAIKVIDTKKIKEDYIRQNLHREAKIMSKLRHPNIIRLYETMKAQTLYCLVLEFAAGGELLAYIKQQDNSRLTENEARTFVRQLVSALHYIHEKNVVHRDLKMENIMLDEKKKNIKLIDFGLSNIYKADEPLRTHCGSPEYAAPELFVVGKTYGPEIDIWSLGIITYAIVIGKLPFFTPYKDEYQRQRMLQQIQKGLSAYHDREMQILTPECRNLLHQVLEPNPEVRIPLSEIKIHPWLTKNGKIPFSPYVQPPKDKQMRHQTTAELAFMTGIKRMMVEETVKEHKADELSAMFNMLMDKKRKQRGFFDIDHTYRKTKHDRESRSRSRDRDKIRVKTPDSHKGKEIKGKTLKKGVGKPKVNNVTRPTSFITPIDGAKPDTKKHITLDVAGKAGSDNSLTDKGPTLALAQAPPPYHQANAMPSSITSSTVKTHHPPPPTQQPLHSILTVPQPSLPPPMSVAAAPTVDQQPSAAIPHHNHHHHHQVTSSSSEQPANKAIPPTVANTSLQSNGPVSRIPFSQRRVPPAKLNMTLDLSVTHTPRKVVPSKDASGEGDSTQNTPGHTTAAGIAATSGVRPKISTSPKEAKESKIPVLSPSRKDILKILCSPTRGIDGSKRPLRPSTLQYIRTSLEKVRKRIPSSDSHKEKEGEGIECKECDEDDCDTKELLAPKATPEDSVIDSYSTSSSSDGDPGPSNICGRKVQIQATVEEIPMQCKATMLNASDDEKLQHVLLGKAHKECVTNYSPEGSGILKSKKSGIVDGSGSNVGSPSHKTDMLTCEETAQSQTLDCDGVRQKDFAKLQTVKQLSFELEGNYDSSTSQLSKSSQNSVGMCPHSHVKHNLLTGSGSSLPMRFQHKLKPTDLVNLCGSLPISGSEPVSVGTVNSKEVQDEQPLSTSLSNPSKLDNTHLSCRACGLSPDSPTYFEKHVRFCHTGAHALDIFTSPDDMPSPPPGAFWRPKTGFSSDSPNQGSPSHNMGILGCMYCFPTVGADTPRVPIQLPIASLEVFDEPDILMDDPKRRLLMDSPEQCRKPLVHIPNLEVCGKAVDKQPSKQSRDKSFLFHPRTAPCSKDKSVYMNTVEAVYTPVPDTSLRLEPVGGSSESLDERVQGDGCTAKTDDQCINNSTPQVCPPTVPMQQKSDEAAKCDLKKPSPLSKASVLTATKQMMNLLHWERSNLPPPPPYPEPEPGTETTGGEQGDSNRVCSGQQCLLNQHQKKCERNKFLRQYDSKNKQMSWRQGLSHLLRKSRTPSANNNITSTSLNTTNTSNTAKVNSVRSPAHNVNRHPRCNSIDDKDDYYHQMDIKWTAPPADSVGTSNVSLEVRSSPVPSNYTTKANQLFDIKSSHDKHGSDVGLTHLDILACKECAKTEEKSSNKNEKTKVTKNGTSPKKPVIIPNSTRKTSAKSKTQPSKV